MNRSTLQFLTVVLFAAVLSACSPQAAKAPAEAAPDRPGEYTRASTAQERANLANFDDLDFNVYTGAHWDQFTRSHAENIVVHYPDGSTTSGLAPHIEMLKPQFAFAPDTKIAAHPIRIAQGDMVAVMGVMEGTFTQPMHMPNGVTVQPTGKTFKLNMMTIGRYENGLMVEEWLEWDNQTFMQQIGLAPGNTSARK